MCIGVSGVLFSLSLGQGDVVVGYVFGVALDVAADEVDGISAERVLWVTGEGGGEFLDSLGAGAFCRSSPFFLLFRVTRVHSLLVSSSGVALVVSMILVVSVVLAVSAFPGRSTKSAAL